MPITDATADLDWPEKAGQVDPMIGQTLDVLFTDLNMNTADVITPLKPPSASVSTIESGMTSGAKLLTFLVGLLGGASAVTVAVSNFWSSSSTSVQTGVVVAFGLIVSATVVSIAVIVGNDVKARGTAMSGLYDARAQVATTFMSRLPTAVVHPDALLTLQTTVTNDLDAVSAKVDDLSARSDHVTSLASTLDELKTQSASVQSDVQALTKQLQTSGEAQDGAVSAELAQLALIDQIVHSGDDGVIVLTDDQTTKKATEVVCDRGGLQFRDDQGGMEPLSHVVAFGSQLQPQ
jgi:hypothetical protein